MAGDFPLCGCLSLETDRNLDCFQETVKAFAGKRRS